MRIRERVFRRDGWLCRACALLGKTTVATEVDHVLPRHRGGTDDLENLQALCSECHARKTAQDMGKAYRKGPTIGLDGWPEG